MASLSKGQNLVGGVLLGFAITYAWHHWVTRQQQG